MRPLLKPALRRLWRDPATLQLGLDPSHSVVLSGVQADDAGLLDLLDGSRNLDELDAEAGRRGHEASRVHLLIKALGDADALDDVPARRHPREGRRTPDLLSLSLQHRAPGAAAAAMARREGTTVEVAGAGRVGAEIAALLSAAGIGRLEVNDPGALRPADFSPGGVRSAGSRLATRAQATRLILGAAGEHATRANARLGSDASDQALIGTSPPEVIVVLAPTTSIVPPEWLATVRHHPHLPVVIRETTAVIGPFVLPGRTPCLRCVELTRGDRDPAWPSLAAQLIGQAHGIEPCDVALASAAASLVALHVLAAVDGGDHPPPPSVGGVLELSLHDLRLRRRTVTAHPGCGCGAADH